MTKKMRPSLTSSVLKRLKACRGIVFDMDGTLTVPAIDFARMRQLCGVPQGRPILETVLAYPEPKRTEALGLIKQVEREGRENLRLLPGTRDILQWLGDEGVPCALLTRNDQEAVEHFVDSLALPTHPLKVLVTREFTPCKPDPAPLIHISSHPSFNVPTLEMLMVGDHSDDIICGQRAGAMTCMVEQHTNVDERYHADFNVVDMHHLLNILKGVWANR